jgi:hypothetical protein
MDTTLKIKYGLANLPAAVIAALLLVWYATPDFRKIGPPLVVAPFVLGPLGYIWMIYSLIWHAAQKLPRSLRLIGILANAIMLLPAAAILGFGLLLIVQIMIGPFHLAD